MPRKEKKEMTHKNQRESASKKHILGFARYWHSKSFLISSIGASAIIATILLMMKYPLAINVPIARFILYSMTMMLPTLVVSAISYPLKIAVSETSYLFTTFTLYFVIFYATLHFYRKQDTREKKIRYILMVMVYTLIFLVASVAYLMKSFYG